MPPKTGRSRSGKPYRKYRNQKTWYLPDGTMLPQAKDAPKPAGAILFDSLKECRRYVVLLAELKAGKIQNLQRQWVFRCRVGPRRVLVCRYVADFTYLRDGVWVVEDVKSEMTRKLREYRLKKSLVFALFNIAITEV